MPDARWYYCTSCGELFPWPGGRTGPARCPVEGCEEPSVRPAPAPSSNDPAVAVAREESLDDEK